MTSGIIFLDKPAGVTSFQALGALKKKLKHKKIGHTGTLDKFATGLIIVLSGSYTRLNQYFTGLDKTYNARITFGQETETLDPEGKVIKQCRIPELSEIKTAVRELTGEQMQVPPDFSAVHIEGKRAYKRKLAGEELEIPPRRVMIYSIEIVKWEKPNLEVAVECSKGTYIRSLARDLGQAAGSCGYVSGLERVKVGKWSLENSVNPEDFDPQEHMVTGKEAFRFLKEIYLLQIKDEAVQLVRNGVPFRKDFSEDKKVLKKGEKFALMSGDDFLGLLEKTNEKFSYGFIAGKDL